MFIRKIKDLKIELWILYTAFTVYFAYFIYKSTFTIDGTVYFRLFDDSMIFMTYAKNLLAGYGLNWAKYGNPVEGFTSPLWVFLMIPVNMLPIALNLKPLVFQVFCFTLLLLNLIFLRKLLVRHYTDNRTIVLLTMALVAFYYPLNHWAVQGMEAPGQSILVILGLYYLLNSTQKDLIKLAVVLSLSLVMRMDMAIFVAIMGTAIAFRVYTRQITISVKTFALCLAIIVLPNLAYLIFRYFYFGDLLPNTYYLKMLNTPLTPRLMRGWYVTSNFLSLSWIPLIILTSYAYFKRTLKTVLPITLFFAYCAYSTYVGGDAWEDTFLGNRFVSFVTPLVFVVFAKFLADLKATKLENDWQKNVRVFLPLSVFVFMAFNGTLPWHEHHKYNWKLISLKKAPKAGVDQYKYMFMSLKLNEIMDPQGVILFGSAGVSGYYSNNRLADALGYNDRVIAKGGLVREITDKNYKSFYPGHMKLNYPYVFAEIKPDLIVEPQFFDEQKLKDEFLALAHENGYAEKFGFWYKKESPYINFARFKELEEFGVK